MQRALLSLAGFLAAVAAAPVFAQTALPSNTSWHGTAGGSAIGRLNRGTQVSRVRTDGEWTLVTVEGWVGSFRLGSRSDTLDRTVIGSGTVPLRAADGPTQTPLGELVPGTVLKSLMERNGWTRVRRSAWIRTSAIEPGAAAPPSVAAPPVSQPPASPPFSTGAATRDAVSGANLRAEKQTEIRANPGGGDTRATIAAGAVVETIARDAGWVRVRIEGWVQERDLVAVDSGAAAQLSAADLRADPAAHRGRMVRWEVEVIAFQRADPLRRGLTDDEPYLLARGPGDESAILYLALPPALVEEARRISPLSTVLITARVRDGRSPPVGVPILDVVSIGRNE